MNDAMLLATDVDFVGALLAAARELLTTFWYLWTFILVVWLGERMLRLHRVLRLRRAGMPEIDRMDGTTFERRLVALFRALGYSARHTGRRGDFGADLVVEKNGRRTAVQAKRSTGRVGVAAVQEALGAKGPYDCAAALVVTNARFTAAARQLARANGVELWGREVLTAKILRARGVDAQEQMGPTPADDGSLHCATCGDRVSDKVREYCLGRPRRFDGRVYAHQRSLVTER